MTGLPLARGGSSAIPHRGSVGVRAGNGFTRSECGIGAMASWGGYLWFTTYPDENGAGTGMGLNRIGDDWRVELVSETNGTHAGRCIAGDWLFIGEHKIHRNGDPVIRLTGFAADDRITAWAKLPTQPADATGGAYFVYCMTMAGKIYRARTDTASAAVEYVSNGATGLNIAGQPHGKGMWGVKNRLYCVFNINAPDGRFGYYDTAANSWTRLETAGDSHIEVAGSYDGPGHAFATGQDQYTGFLWLIDAVNSTPNAPRRFLLPLTTKQQVQGWQQEWMRIRMADTERFLMDFHGGWFGLSSFLDGGDNPSVGFPRIEPIARHSRTNTDFTVHGGKLCIGGNQSSAQSANKYPNTGQSQSTMVILDSTDDLYAYGKPTGSGYMFRGASVAANAKSDPMLMRGYDGKSLHLRNGGAGDVAVNVLVYHENTEMLYVTITVPTGGYVHHEFPRGFGADWVAVQPTAAANPLSAWMVYT